MAHFAAIDHAKRFEWQVNDEFVRKHEYQTIRPLFESLRDKPGLQVLEVGCGEGVNLMHLKQLGLSNVDIQGIDPSAEAIGQALKHGLDVKVADGLDLPFAEHSFDAVFCRDVLHHLPDREARKKFIEEMSRVAKPGATITIIEPNSLNPLIWALSAVVQAEKGLCQTREKTIREFLPQAEVYRVSPSCLWRMLYHYRSPLHGNRFLSGMTRSVISAWDWMCTKTLPSAFWSYRVYQWQK